MFSRSPPASNPERQIIEKLITHLKQISEHTLLGYSATGQEQDLDLPAILVQLESINEEQRQGQRAKYRMAFNISAVAKTNKDTTFTLLDLTRSIRELFTTGQRFTPEARHISFSETQFDIAPSNAHLSFADLQLQIEVIL
ncbi:hypothetical protein J7438_23300 [Thalassotalea sp. G20_0]|uniref:phage tail terminator family protein n=1 Tax=Thalassotalea sp. G20_0 TaxID=2821093 RepID=UPI001ADC971E|nr:hypothetical protein [Thalassotalea sp. G20_0]MBO9496992.1 hypothetical protein [Thalassotalea sp. G20_0]